MTTLSRRERGALAANIIYQRTDLGSLSRTPWLRNFAGYESLVRLDGRLFSGRVVREYLRCMEHEWRSIEKWIPAGASSVLDIGCGAAGLHRWTFRHFCESRVRATKTPAGQADQTSYSLTLCDRNETCDRIYYDFNAQGAAYNDLALSRAFLSSLGLPSESIRTIDVDRDALPCDRPFDLIVSLISWGFHYPIETYLEYTRSQLADDGVMIVDSRRETGGLEALQESFETTIIAEGQKHDRVLCRHR